MMGTRVSVALGSAGGVSVAVIVGVFVEAISVGVVVNSMVAVAFAEGASVCDGSGIALFAGRLQEESTKVPTITMQKSG
jgi:hypothetical protein